jgi:hypothetical protein
MVVFRWHSPRIAFTSQAIETPKVKGKPRFDHIVRMSHSRGQSCPQFAPIFFGGSGQMGMQELADLSQLAEVEDRASCRIPIW